MFLTQNCSDDVDLTGLTEAQKTALITAWSFFEPQMVDNSRNIFAEFFEQSPEYLKFFDGLENEAMHRHTDEALKFYMMLINDCLKNPKEFSDELFRFTKLHRNLTGTDIAKLNRIVRRYILEQVFNHQSKTLEDALDAFFYQIESKFAEHFDWNDEEL